MEDPGGAGKPARHLSTAHDFVRRREEPRIRTVYRSELVREPVASICRPLRLRAVRF